MVARVEMQGLNFSTTIQCLLLACLLVCFPNVLQLFRLCLPKDNRMTDRQTDNVDGARLNDETMEILLSISDRSVPLYANAIVPYKVAC